MNPKETLLGGLLGTEIQRMRGKFEFYGIETGVPSGESWVSKDSVTLEQFLEQNPTPGEGEDLALYGIGWEFIWGKKPPQVITDAKNLLIAKSRTGMEINDTEKLWLKVMSVDTDMF